MMICTNENALSSKRQAKNQAKSSFCLICHAEARIINYGVLSCYSCKAFFRRHSFRKKSIRTCRFDNQCEINIDTRKFCASCRLNKCLTMGMSTKFIRKVYQKSKDDIVKKTTKSILSIYSLDLLENSRSLLNDFERTILSNVLHAFDQFSLIPSMIHLVNHFDDSITSEINLFQSFRLFASFYSTVESFLQSTADFRVLTLAEQRSLFQRNLHGLFNYCGTFMLRDAGIFNNHRNENLIIPLYGYDIVQQAKQIVLRLDYDSILVKFIHIIFAFSTSCFRITYDSNMNQDALLRGMFRLFGSQNFYTEILWKYMIYRYGHQETVLRFAGLVKHMLDLINLSTGIYQYNQHHQILVDDLVEEAKISLILDENVNQPLWGKTIIQN